MRSRHHCRYIKLLLALFICTYQSLPAANLQFSERVLSKKQESLSDTVVSFSFPFKNIESKPIRIENVTTSCGCTDYVLDRRIIGPGESGVFIALVDLKGRKSDLTAMIRIKTDIDSTPISLSVVAEVAKELLTIVGPRFLTWELKDGITSKRVGVRLSGRSNIAFTGVRSSSKDFNARLIRDTGDPDTYWIEITPTRLVSAMNATIVPLEENVELRQFLPQIRIYAYVF